jgi:hypothetical protein
MFPGFLYRLFFLLLFIWFAFESRGQEMNADVEESEPDSTQIVDVHPQDSPENKGFLITSRDGRSSLRIRGSIRLLGAMDLNGLQTKSTFSTYDIPVGDANVQEVRYVMSIDQTRLGLEAERETVAGNAFMRVEVDFMNENSTPRLRHVYGSLGKFLVGQTWSVFSDVASLPNTVDLDGPNGSAVERTVQIRYSNRLKGGIRYSVSAELPDPDLEYPDTIQIEPSFQSFPDIAARFRKQTKTGHFQVAGILRSINTKDTAAQVTYQIGIGGLASGNVKIDDRSELRYHAFVGQAIAKYITGISGKGLDVIYSSIRGRFETLGEMGGFVSYGFKWKPQLYSYFTGGAIKIFNKSYQPDDAMSYSYYFSGNMFWDTKAGTRAGIEYAYGRRVDKDGQQGGANRISFIFYYDF